MGAYDEDWRIVPNFVHSPEFDEDALQETINGEDDFIVELKQVHRRKAHVQHYLIFRRLHFALLTAYCGLTSGTTSTTSFETFNSLE